jgi:hypothetical protein
MMARFSTVEHRPAQGDTIDLNDPPEEANRFGEAAMATMQTSGRRQRDQSPDPVQPWRDAPRSDRVFDPKVRTADGDGGLVRRRR